MGSLRLDHFLEFMTSGEVLVGLLWAGLAALSVTLLLLMQTRWGQSRPLRKCLVLSLLAHLLFLGYATTVHIVAAMPPGPDEPVIQVAIAEPGPAETPAASASTAQEKPWEAWSHDTVSQPAPTDLSRRATGQAPEPKRTTPSRKMVLSDDPLLGKLALDEAARPDPEEVRSSVPMPKPAASQSAQKIDAPAAQRREPPELAMRPVPDQLARTASGQKSLSRAATTGVPSSLLERAVPLPRMASRTTTPKPADSLAGLTDQQQASPHGKPVEAAHQNPLRDGPRPGGVAGLRGETDSGYIEHPASSDLVSVAGRRKLAMEGTGSSDDATAETGPPQLPSNRGGGDDQLPSLYQLRVAPDRAQIAQRQGATPQSEAAVEAALKWLADNQQPDGRWNAQSQGAGRETRVAGRDRQGAGLRADTGLSGLALLAFMASGNTHQKGEYRENVRRGLSYLVLAQKPSGNLAGEAGVYAGMYCHAMATFALSEAYAMTRDQRLHEPVRRAITYTLAAQDPGGGGWRYQPRDQGDTSQLGWQLMAIKSAELAGFSIPEETREGAIRYLKSVSSGQSGGLAAYREGQQASRSMTAEAMVCRQFLGMPPASPTATEAADYLLEEMPGQGRDNLYYWYYATVGLYQLQDERWQKWNEALRKTLVESQRKEGALAGSWEPDFVWAGYGGRVYSTAVAALCLEVYYRYLPLYVANASTEGGAR